MKDENDLYPLTFRPIYKEKVWGGRSLERLGRPLPGDGSTKIGESWELADLASTSPSGGGGGAEHSVVADGSLAGRTIRQLIQAYGDTLLGPAHRSADGGFPLLIKLLDARENLSVQVHPSPAYAAEHPEAHLKSEAWYILDADPGAVIYKGLAVGVTPAQFRAAIEANSDDEVVPLLRAVPVRPGDCHYLPSGTCHALGAGVVVAEVQTPSDTTFRVYDWGRTGRELHVDQAMACIDFGEPAEPGLTRRPDELDGFNVERKASCAYFDLDRVSSVESADTTLDLRAAEAWIGLMGGLTIDTGRGEPYELCRGATVLLPAALRHVRLHGAAGGNWLRVSLPVADR